MFVVMHVRELLRVQEGKDIDNATIDSSFDSDYVDNYDDTTTESSNDDVEEEI